MVEFDFDQLVQDAMKEHQSQWATSLSLLEGIRQGRDEGWQRFVHLYTPLIYFWCRKAGLQESDAADVSQDVFRAVYSGIDGLDYGGPNDSFRGWLWTITRRTLARHHGRDAKSPAAPGGSTAMMRTAQLPDWVDNDEVPDSPTAEAEVMRRAADLIRDDFQEHTWQAFWLSTVEEMPTEVVAEKLGMSAGGVRQAKFRVLARLKEFVGFA